MMNEGKAVANVVQMAPGTRFILYPIKVLRLIANTPGQLCATAIRSTNSSLLIHFRFSTISDSIIGIIAYPPPRVNAPILKKVLKLSQYTIFICFKLFFCCIVHIWFAQEKSLKCY